MVRLVFRPYTQIRRSICTLESLRASIRVSSDFTLFRHSSPSFGSQHIRSYSNLSVKRPGRSMMRRSRIDDHGSHLSKPSLPLLSLCPRVFHPKTRAYVRLLGPCFKTGRLKPFRQHPKGSLWTCQHLNITIMETLPWSSPTASNAQMKVA